MSDEQKKPPGISQEVWDRSVKMSEISASVIEEIQTLTNDPDHAIGGLVIAMARLVSAFDMKLPRVLNSVREAYAQCEAKRPKPGSKKTH